MCIVCFSINESPDYPLILIANRDEFFDRPTQPLHKWSDDSTIYAGRDQRAGGTWLGVTEGGRWGALTNFRGTQNSKQYPLSRGGILHDFFTSSNSIQQWMENFSSKADQYNGFNLVIGEQSKQNLQALYFSSSEKNITVLNSGTHVVSNGSKSLIWPKMKWLESSFSREVNTGSLSNISERLFSILKHDIEAPIAELPNTGISQSLERKLSSPFITPFELNKKTYGTRCSTILTIHQSSEISIQEINFDKQSNNIDHQQFSFLINHPNNR